MANSRLWKYPIVNSGDVPSPGTCNIKIPRGATILSVGIDIPGNVCLWALVDPTRIVSTRNIAIEYTGASLENE